MAKGKRMYACGLQHFPQTREVGDAGVEDGDGGIEEVEGGLQAGDAALERGCHCSFLPHRSSRSPRDCVLRIDRRQEYIALDRLFVVVLMWVLMLIKGGVELYSRQKAASHPR